jgi:hypothetical protein
MLDKTLKLVAQIAPGTYVDNPTEAFDEAELTELAKLLKPLLYAPSHLRAYLQSLGVTLTPSNYYSEIPTITEIERTFSVKPEMYCADLFDSEKLRQYILELLPFAIEFDPPQQGHEIGAGVYGWKSGMYSYSDAMSYYSIIRYLQPQKIIEFGSGFSSLIAVEALRKNGGGSLTCIEPFPREFLRKNSEIELVQKSAQEITAQYINDTLDDGDILFIDSTHTVKHGSDCLHLYLNVIPAIKKDIFVHVHDIYLPQGLPLSHLRDKQIYWTEQYLLGAYLLDNPKVNILFSSFFNLKYNKDLLLKMMHGRYAPGGAALWFKLNGKYAVGK